jgi:NADH:ubiquinone oxidoreductase subunit 3 (subunit A)
MEDNDGQNLNFLKKWVAFLILILISKVIYLLGIQSQISHKQQNNQKHRTYSAKNS